ncbi:MAG: hypothetical protein FJX55_00890 [Alphaproteobacteria bacterium]|nr:hypothetical protein [Alphaproteobacteria bacterium]
MARAYIALIHKERKNDFGVSFPDFPGCVTAGSTLQEAADMAAEALELHIEGMTVRGNVRCPMRDSANVCSSPGSASPRCRALPARRRRERGG